MTIEGRLAIDGRGRLPLLSEAGKGVMLMSDDSSHRTVGLARFRVEVADQ
jgi:hypothetical protein